MSSISDSVLNVIEDPAERVEAVKAAFGLARRLMAVAVMLVGKADTSTLRPFRDGFVTAHKTFQKYFLQQEARTLISHAVGEEAIPVGPGIFFVFRDKVSEQRFLESRRRRHRDISHLLAIAPPRATSARTEDEALVEEQREVIDAVWEDSNRARTTAGVGRARRFRPSGAYRAHRLRPKDSSARAAHLHRRDATPGTAAANGRPDGVLRAKPL